MAKKEETFETSLSRLEKIVHELENGDVPLDRSLALFEEGVGLVKFCGKKLDEAEQKITVLTANENGGYDEKDFGKTE